MSNLKIISLFSGAGGLDIGFHAAGFSTAVAVEIDTSCCETLKVNMPEVPVICGDLTKTPTAEILKKGGLAPMEAALVIGGPPCQSFSLAGKRMGLNDPKGQLVLEFIRVVREALPKVFVMENVKGMVNWAGGRALQAIFSEASLPIEFEGSTYSYELSYKVLNAVDFGAPQFRERVIIVGQRLGKPFVFPTPTHTTPVTVWDAIGNLPPADEPSETALRVSGTIKERIKNHGY